MHGSDVEIAHRFVTTPDLTFHVAQAGPEDGPLVLLLHGFPEFWYGWHKQIGPLARAGFRVWVPDQRGYNRSEKPRGVGAYRIDRLAADVVALIDAAGQDRAAIVGHDWGGAVAWWAAIHHPDRIARLVAINSPHMEAVRIYTPRHPRQWVKSLYMLFFQFPWLPEALSRWRGWRLATFALTSTSRPGTFTPDDLAQYRTAWEQPGAFTAMLNWYRALPRSVPLMPRDPRVRVPTLILWGVQDFALSRGLADLSRDLCDDAELVFFEDATHWLPLEEPEAVNRHLIAFLGGAQA